MRELNVCGRSGRFCGMSPRVSWAGLPYVPTAGPMACFGNTHMITYCRPPAGTATVWKESPQTQSSLSPRQIHEMDRLYFCANPSVPKRLVSNRHQSRRSGVWVTPASRRALAPPHSPPPSTRQGVTSAASATPTTWKLHDRWEDAAVLHDCYRYRESVVAHIQLPSSSRWADS